jgi:hypothetical protein
MVGAGLLLAHDIKFQQPTRYWMDCNRAEQTGQKGLAEFSLFLFSVPCLSLV